MNSVRTSPTKPIQLHNRKMPKRTMKVGVMTDAMMMITYSVGTDPQISMKRWK